MLDVIAEMYKDHSIALVGCRVEGINYECCEYDLIIPDAKKDMIKVDDAYIEIHSLGNNKIQTALQLFNSEILQDPSLLLTTLKQSINADILNIHAKSLLIDAVLDASDAKNITNLLEASFLLKRSAYRYMNAILELNLIRPAPLHIFQQLKELDIDLTLVLECLGTSRANSSSIIRALNMLKELPSYMLINRKISYLYDKYRYVDCYIYLTHLGINLTKDYHSISDNLRIILNLDADESIRKLAVELLKECKLLLNSKY